jgi:glycosyltransferase involved in cell wall biosynthesis
MSGFRRHKIAVSEAVRDELASFYGFSDVTVVESGVDLALFRPAGAREHVRRRFSVPVNAFVGLYVGRWERAKGSDIMEGLAARTPDIYWLLVLASGGGPCALQTTRTNVCVLQDVTYEELPQLYSLADFLFVPSRYEGFGLTVTEAMACGLPALVGDVGIARKIYHDEPFSSLRLPAFPVPEEEVLRVAAQIISAIRQDEALRRHVAQRGREIVEDHYTLDRWEKRMGDTLGLPK